MFDDFLPIPDAESLPFHPAVLKLVVCVGEEWLPAMIFLFDAIVRLFYLEMKQVFC